MGRNFMLKNNFVIRFMMLVVFLYCLVRVAQAEEGLEQVAISEASFASRMDSPKLNRISRRRVIAKAGPNFSGFWGGEVHKSKRNLCNDNIVLSISPRAQPGWRRSGVSYQS